ncbi:MAG TPA: quinone-dependent dihydroorotate dehydrogenase [Candidatus Paceibacterota bacterium]
MKSAITGVRNAVSHAVYRGVVKPICFRFDPELVHDFISSIGVGLGMTAIGRLLTRAAFGYSHKQLEQDVLGIHFKNPVGLSAGFDKNGKLTDIMPSVGFGFVEVGSVTGSPCAGNPKPRLWRVPQAKSLLVYYGLANDGAAVIASRLSQKRFAIPVGVSVAMTNCKTTLDISEAVEDYARAFETVKELASYITVNISCPNTVGGQPFLNGDHLNRLLTRLDSIPTAKPVFIKLSPDMAMTDVDSLLEIAAGHRVQGIICTNLTKRRVAQGLQDGMNRKGGLSGKAVNSEADALLAHVYRTAGKRFVIVGVGGIFSAEDAYRKIRLGASLVQLITGMIFEGPQLISDINLGLVRLLKRDGLTSIRDAIGIDNPLRN